MKSFTKLALASAVGLIMGISSQAAFAQPFSNAFTPGVVNTLRDNSAEEAFHFDGTNWVALTPGQQLVAGDILAGWFHISSTVDPANIAVGNGNPGNYNSVTGVFATQVLSAPVDLGPSNPALCSGLPSCSTFVFGSGTTTLWDKLTAVGYTVPVSLNIADSMLAFFEDNNNLFPEGSNTQNGIISEASSGILRIVVGDAASTGTDPAPFWSAVAPADPAELFTLPVGTQGGNFSFNQNISYLNGWNVVGNQVGGNGTVSASLSGNPFPIEDQTSFKFQVNVPEPGSLALIGIGLAAFGVGKKRRS